MRAALMGLVALLLLGSAYSPGRSSAVDMVSARYSNTLPSPTHLGHWPAPSAGRAVTLTANMMDPGTGAGTVTFGVLVEGTGVVCTLEASCTLGAADFPTVACPDNAIPAGAHVHLEYSHTCTTAPHGNLVAGFEWAR